MEKQVNPPILEIVNKLNDPTNSLTDEEKNQVRLLTGNVSSAVKTSLIQLLMGQFSQVNRYNEAINNIMKSLNTKMVGMETDELIALLSVLTKTSEKSAKSVMEMFKKQGDDVKGLIEGLEKMAKKGSIVDGDDLDSPKIRERKILPLSDEKKDKLLRVVKKFTEAQKEQVVKDDDTD